MTNNFKNKQKHFQWPEFMGIPVEKFILEVSICFYATWKSTRSEILQRYFVRFTKAVCFLKKTSKVVRDISSLQMKM